MHMLSLLEGANLSEPVARLRALVEAEGAAIGYRSEKYEDPGEVAGALDQALEQLRATRTGSGATSHMSTADTSGQVCALTESNGYGSGLVAQGVLLNNTLGEEELNPRGAFGLLPGSRCHSNMTPTIASGRHLRVALGSPGADRIVGAIAQTLIVLAVDGASLAEAVARPGLMCSTVPTDRCFASSPASLQRHSGFPSTPTPSRTCSSAASRRLRLTMTAPSTPLTTPAGRGTLRSSSSACPLTKSSQSKYFSSPPLTMEKNLDCSACVTAPALPAFARRSRGRELPRRPCR